MDDLGVEIGAPRPVDPSRQEQTRDQEEVGHAKRPSPFDEPVQRGGGADRPLDPEGRVHHDDQDDADALGHIDPVQPAGCAVSRHPAAPPRPCLGHHNGDSRKLSMMQSSARLRACGLVNKLIRSHRRPQKPVQRRPDCQDREQPFGGPCAAGSGAFELERITGSRFRPPWHARRDSRGRRAFDRRCPSRTCSGP